MAGTGGFDIGVGRDDFLFQRGLVPGATFAERLGPLLRDLVSDAEPSICGSIAARACTAPSLVASRVDSAAENCGSPARASS